MPTSNSFPWTPEDRSLVDRYLAGECAPEERARAERLLRDVPGPGLAARALAAADPPYTADDLRASWSGVQRRLAADNDPRVARPAFGASRWWLRGAGAAAALLLGAGVWRMAARPDHRAVAAPARVYRTANAQTATVTLPDGTRATLGPATTLTLAADFGAASRAVTVVGETRFVARADARAPFVVRAGAATARVLGTTFTVRRYAGDAGTRVAVRDGRVLLGAARANGGAVVLGAAAVGLAPDSGRVVTLPARADEYTDWSESTLRFRDTPLRDVLGDLGRAYDAEIVNTDTTLAAQVVTLTVSTARESLPQVLDGLMLSLGAHYTRAGHTITIRPGRAAADRKTRTPHQTPEHVYGR